MPDSAPLPAAKLSPKVDELQVTTGAFPSSRKVFASSMRYAGLRVAMDAHDDLLRAGAVCSDGYDSTRYSASHRVSPSGGEIRAL